MTSRHLSIGILLIQQTQTLDITAPLDLLVNLSRLAVEMFFPHLDANKLNAPTFDFHFIGPNVSSSEQQQHILQSTNVHVLATTTYRTCPQLDYLLIGGPDPAIGLALPTDLLTFVLDRAKRELTAIFTTCTGAFILAGTGLLKDGVEATANHSFIDVWGPKISPETKWNKHKNWVVSSRDRSFVVVDAAAADGEHRDDALQIWTAAGAIAGMDMFAEWARQEFGQELVDCATSLTEYQPRDVDGKGMRYVNGRREVVNP